MDSNAGSGTHKNTSSSLSAFLSTLIPVAAQAAVFFLIFLILRASPKYNRVYRPRTYLDTLQEHERTTDLPNGKFSWLKPFRKTPDEYALNHQSMDGYLYLRFLKILTIICFVGCCCIFPVLFPVNITGHGGQMQLDMLSFSNLGPNDKKRYYAHAGLAWVFFGFVMFMVTKEMIYYINLRNAYLLAPFNATKMSSRTVLFTDVPAEYQNVETLRALFGSALRRVWLATNTKKLGKLVKERDKDAMKLEGAEIKLSRNANKRRLKWEKNNAKTERARDPSDAETATLGSRWAEKKDRPTHRTGKIPLIGRKVDTINWGRTELRRLIPEVDEAQRAHLKFQGKLLPAVFVEFNTVQAAESAYRRMSPRKPPKMNTRAVFAAPHEIVWGNLRIKKPERALRVFATTAFIILMIIFWSIPVGIVGAISHVDKLTNKVHFLDFINKIPKSVLGVVTGLLPAVLLAVLMALVPIVCRFMAKLGGEVTTPAIELKTQSWYMAFQVVQVFLITTCASGASQVVTQIISNPSSATTLLAQNLPLASDFYISYFIVQGLGIAAGNLLNIGALVMLTIVGKYLDKTPRKMFKRYNTLAGQGWGSLYPKFGNLGIIAITYSIISPLVLGFATVGFFLVYLAQRYNTFYILGNNIDTKGAAYGRALQQLTTGVYLGEICLLGLFALNKTPGPIAMTGALLAVTAIYHFLMNRALKPLTRYLPDSLEGQGPAALFNSNDKGSYDARKANAPPTEAHFDGPSKVAAAKASLLTRLFDPRHFKSYQRVQSLVPKYAATEYDERDGDRAYYNPVVTSPTPRLWIVRDEMGISREEIRETGEVLPITDDYTRFDAKNKVAWVWGREGEGARLRDMPVWDRKVEY